MFLRDFSAAVRHIEAVEVQKTKLASLLSMKNHLIKTAEMKQITLQQGVQPTADFANSYLVQLGEYCFKRIMPKVPLKLQQGQNIFLDTLFDQMFPETK